MEPKQQTKAYHQLLYIFCLGKQATIPRIEQSGATEFSIEEIETIPSFSSPLVFLNSTSSVSWPNFKIVILLLSFLFATLFYTLFGDNMKVKIFDEEYEKDLENDINEFLSDFEGDIIEIKYQVALGIFSEEQIYCFSAMIIYTN